MKGMGLVRRFDSCWLGWIFCGGLVGVLLLLDVLLLFGLLIMLLLGGLLVSCGPLNEFHWGISANNYRFRLVSAFCLGCGHDVHLDRDDQVNVQTRERDGSWSVKASMEVIK